MLSFLPASLRGIIVGLLLLINIMVFSLLVILFGLLKHLIPFKSLRASMVNIQNDVITGMWTDVNTWLVSLPGRIQWQVKGEGTLDFNRWYFVVCNHQTWADILILQQVFNHKIRLLKFFLKQELLWSLPFGGVAVWMLDYPFMKRYSKNYLKKHPEKKTADIDATRAACQIFKNRPTTVMNFLEGTRFTPEKRRDRSSPYQHLLRPKAGGVAFVVSELQEYIKEVIDVTIVYSETQPTFWKLLSGQISQISVVYRVIPLNEQRYGDYYQDKVYRRDFQNWINDLWHQKDRQIAVIQQQQTVGKTSVPA